MRNRTAGKCTYVKSSIAILNEHACFETAGNFAGGH
jgi:hypothetical protein